jgi:hypothetical protein
VVKATNRSTRSLARLLAVSALAAAATVTACGGDKDNDDKGSESGDCEKGVTCPGNGWVTKATGASIEIDFSKAQKDWQYAIMPYVLGAADAKGGVDAEQFTFKIEAPGAGTAAASGAGLIPMGQPLRLARAFTGATPPLASGIKSWNEYALGARSLMHRFSKADADQGAAFWRLAQELDAFARAHGRADDLEAYFRAWQAAPAKRSRHAARLLTASGCPGDGDSVSMPNGTFDNPGDATVPAGGAVDGGDFCIVYLDAPVTEPNKDKIKATIDTVLKRYKTVIYGDTFPAVGSYTFKPIVVVVNVGSATSWKSAVKPLGLFVPQLSEDANQPMLYMASDVLQSDGHGTDAALNNRLWHSTIAHEMQHAIINYYRVYQKKPGTAEIGSIDEGLAHFMEEVYGYGEENFEGFAYQFISGWNNTLSVIHSSETGPTYRGATLTLLYYLASQKGGLKFTDGVVSGGDGLTFITKVVKDATAIGPANLATAYGGDWTETIGNFFGAMMLDGSDTADLDDKYTVQEPVKTLTDLQGNANKPFGFHLNGVGEQPKSRVIDADSTLPKATETAGSPLYATQPLLYVVGDPTAKVKLTLPEAQQNVAAAVVRVK